MEKVYKNSGGKEPFFRPVDWRAFWTATIVSFVVYFLTLGPSVTLEDSGELAVAGDHLGVPHPPGYPIWTMCAYIFARIFSWVKYYGQPTPAWSIALMSGVFAALAAGITAMLITRSASDMLRDAKLEEGEFERSSHNLLCWAGGVGGSLVFAFSPVMWSQATIVEVYTLNAFFLMWIFLLTYRWMRLPSDKILWLTAFVFGLGLTNYQVLLLAALPLVIVIFLRNIALFRDFLLVGIPVVLTAHILQIGAETGANPTMSGPAYAKMLPLTKDVAVPSMGGLVAGIVLVAVALVLAVLSGSKDDSSSTWRTKLHGISTVLAPGLAGFGGILILFSSTVAKVSTVSALDAPLLQPDVYTSIAGLIVLIIACSIGGALMSEGRWNNKTTLGWLLPAVVLSLVVFFRISAVKGALMPAGYTGLPFDWTLPGLVMVGGLAVLFTLAATTPKGIFFALPVAVLQISVFALLRKGGMHGLTHPTTWWFWWPVIWNFVVIGLAWLTLPHGRTVAVTALAAELGVSFYIYMPIVSDLRNPPMNWGYPRTWDGFKHAITRGQYEKLAPSDVFTTKFLFQLGTYFTDLRVQFTLIAATLGFLPFTVWSFKAKGQRIRALYIAGGMYLLSSVLVLISEVMRGEPFLRLDKLLIGLILLLMLAGSVAVIFRQLETSAKSVLHSGDLSEQLTKGISLAGVAAVITLFIAKGLISLLSTGQGATEPGTGIKAAAFLLALIVVVAGAFAIRYLFRVAEKRFEFHFEMDNIAQQWLIATAAGFLVMSVLLVVLANIKGDLQDAFIQKVKFISSHGLFAIWIGYGLVYGLFIGMRVLRMLQESGRLASDKMRLLRNTMVCAAVMAAGIPVFENYTNDYLIFSMSGAEQNGHTFGWQFGNYQLRGADAITEEMDADDEPLPNPLFPPEMEQGAIFFGGTDPGRFVPTYMIYSANVRPDVFLITQNALADNTYMATMRDLYGNDIWIPTPDDSAEAFQVYVDEVRAGKRQPNAALTIENGKVQVSGALGVMEINGILCDMIFAKNKLRHAFYIEESYVINWMYPYLSPHGLIMKINAEKTTLSTIMTEDDLDFWEWYTRKLLRDPMFRRDVPAQKSFSKLRSAIAGLYASRGMRNAAEIAFQEARMLYPVSPEANFRLVQEVFLYQGRYDESLEVLEEYNRRDPNNSRGHGFVDFVQKMKKRQERVGVLEEQIRSQGNLTAEQTYELSMAYRDLGRNDMAIKYLLQLSEQPRLGFRNALEVGVQLSLLKQHQAAVKVIDQLLPHLPDTTPPDHLLDIVKVLGAAGEREKIVVPLSRYLQARPQDWSGWLDMASISLSLNRQQQAQYALQKALEHGKGEAFQKIQENAALSQAALPILQRIQQQSRGNIGLPAVGPRNM